MPSRQRKQKARPWLRYIAAAGALLTVIWLLSITLQPTGFRRSINLLPFSEKLDALTCILTRCPQRWSSLRFLIVDVLGNILVFVPFGFTLGITIWPATPLTGTPSRRRKLRWWGWLGLSGLLLSLVIESTQLLIPSRATDVDDLILNTLGTLLGAAIVSGIAASASNELSTRN